MQVNSVSQLPNARMTQIDRREPLHATGQFECGLNRDSILIFKLALLFCKAPGHVKSRIYQSLKYLNSAAMINKTSNWTVYKKCSQYVLPSPSPLMHANPLHLCRCLAHGQLYVKDICIPKV